MNIMRTLRNMENTMKMARKPDKEEYKQHLPPGPTGNRRRGGHRVYHPVRVLGSYIYLSGKDVPGNKITPLCHKNHRRAGKGRHEDTRVQVQGRRSRHPVGSARGEPQGICGNRGQWSPARSSRQSKRCGTYAASSAGELQFEDIEGYLIKKSTVSTLQVDNVVEIAGGPFKGMKATITRIDHDKEEATVILLDAPYQLPVTVDANYLKASPG